MQRSERAGEDCHCLLRINGHEAGALGRGPGDGPLLPMALFPTLAYGERPFVEEAWRRFSKHDHAVDSFESAC